MGWRGGVGGERESVCVGGVHWHCSVLHDAMCVHFWTVRRERKLMRVRSKGCGRWRSYSMRKLEEEGIQVVVRRCVVCVEEMG
jgi:hypothetical protein